MHDSKRLKSLIKGENTFYLVALQIGSILDTIRLKRPVAWLMWWCTMNWPLSFDYGSDIMNWGLGKKILSRIV